MAPTQQAPLPPTKASVTKRGASSGDGQQRKGAELSSPSTDQWMSEVRGIPLTHPLQGQSNCCSGSPQAKTLELRSGGSMSSERAGTGHEESGASNDDRDRRNGCGSPKAEEGQDPSWRQQAASKVTPSSAGAKSAGEGNGSETEASPRDPHSAIRCKPCAFYYNLAKGCRNGESCTYCHHQDHKTYSLKQWKKMQRSHATPTQENTSALN
eukprot:GHVN01092713.1.p1 GENE.GHVN01092713.1~~GHVN01092713.1.p1  ORF type:complete len:228 (+),score=55.32 GHVN01092713.1:52-684(+)